MTPDEYKSEIERLKKEVEYWKDHYHKAKDEVEKLSLDLGLKDYPQSWVKVTGD